MVNYFEVLLTDGDFRIINMIDIGLPGPAIQHNCCVEPLGARDAGTLWRNWAFYRKSALDSYAATEYLLKDLSMHKCAWCQLLPSEGLRAMYLFLVI